MKDELSLKEYLILQERQQLLKSKDVENAFWLLVVLILIIIFGIVILKWIGVIPAFEQVCWSITK